MTLTPSFSSATLVFLLKSMHSTTPITDLEATAKATASCFHTANFLPHGLEVAYLVSDLRRQSSMRAVQTAMGEDPSRMSKINTKGVCTSTIADHHAIISMCGNVTTFLLTLCKFDATSIDAKDVPFLHYVARRVGLLAASIDMRKYLDRTPCHAMLNYYIFNVVDRTFTTYFRLLEDEQSINAARPDNGAAQLSLINLSHVTMASNCLESGLTTIANICAEAETVKETSIYTNSVYHIAATPITKRKPEEQTTPRDPKRPKTPGQRNVGWFIMKGKKTMPWPTKREDWPQGETPLCAAKSRHGSHGCRNPSTCELNHKPPKAWSATLFEFMKKHVAAHDELSWNPDVVNPEMIGMQYSQSTPADTEVKTDP